MARNLRPDSDFRGADPKMRVDGVEFWDHVQFSQGLDRMDQDLGELSIFAGPALQRRKFSDFQGRRT